MNIEEGIQKLVTDKSVEASLFDVVVEVARKCTVPGRRAGIVEEDAPESLAADFVVALAGEEISGVVVSKSDLAREFKRWLTRRSDPQGSEVWAAVSQALLELERRGQVCRPLAKRRFHNSNDTTWSLPNNEACPGDLTKLDSIEDVFPALCAKKAGDRAISPTEAKLAILSILSHLGGETAMNTIVECIKSRLPLFSVSRSLDLEASEEEDGFSQYEKIETECVPGDYSLLIEEEAADTFERIWTQVKALRRGGKSVVDGVRVLCCYLIPKEVAGEKRTLDELGPSSTVKDVLDDVVAVLAEHLPRSLQNKATKSLDNWICVQVTSAVLEKIIYQCSENGHCQAFDLR